MPPRNLTIILVSAVVSLACYFKTERNRDAVELASAIQIIKDNYVEEVNPRDLFEGAMDGMVQRLDQYSNYISPEDFRQFTESLDQEFGGIGIVVELNPDTKRMTVLSPVVGTPAYKAGLRAGDTILEIDGQSTEGMALQDAVPLIKGKPGTTVNLTVRHTGEQQPEQYTIERANIQTESVLGDTRRADDSWNFVLEQHPRIGYMRLTTFGERTVEELKRALGDENLKIDALILDLRNNAGGLLKSAVDMCDLFIDNGEIVRTKGRGGEVKSRFTASPGTIIDPQIPMVVLVNRYSASASEIVAACLQDNIQDGQQRAIVVGQRTWGKGTVQNVIRLEGGSSALKLTTASYWRPSGKDIHRNEDESESDDWGVRPDEGFEVILTDDEFEQVLKDRQQRDIIRTGTSTPESTSPTPNDSTSKTPDSGESDSPSSIADPQLRKAVEYLQQQIERADQLTHKA